MLDLTNLIGFGVGAHRSAVQTEPVLLNLSGASVLMFNGAGLGNPEPSRVIIVNVVANRSVNATVSMTCTLNGMSMSNRLLYVSGGKYHAIFTGLVPEGETGDIVLTFGSGNFNAFISVIAATGGLNEVPHDTSTIESTSAGLTLSIPEDGLMLCNHNTNNTNADAAWIGATEIYGAAFTNNANSGSLSADLRMPAEIDRAITITASGSSESAAGATFGWA